MLPLYLQIEGFYSYQEKQEIDFTKLTEGGLFGIFGSVGSGKSSILEAISLALYGDTERLNKTDKRGYNMMNLKSTQTSIVFDFLNFENKKYRFTAQWRRKNKNFEDTSTIERTAYEFVNDKWTPLESADASRITQLSYPNFRRTIIIPQGQFQEFLELKGKDRSEMMKEIFRLNKFDLGPNVSFLQTQNTRKLDNLTGALSGYDSISSELLSEKENIFETEKTRLQQLKALFDEAQSKLQLLKEMQERHKELENKTEELNLLITDEAKIKQQEKDLNHYEQTVNIFRELLNAVRKTEMEKEVLTRLVDDLREKRNKTSLEIDDVRKTLTLVENEYEQLDSYRMQRDDFESLILIKQHELKHIGDLESFEKGKPIVDQTRKQLETLREQLIWTENQLSELKNKQLDISQLIDIESWYLTNDTWIKQIETLNSQRAQISKGIEQSLHYFSHKNLSFDQWEMQLETENDKTNQQIVELSKEETHLQVQEKLGEFAESLEQGYPCPMCGSVDHPAPMVIEHVHGKLQEVIQQKNRLQAEQKERAELSHELHRISADIQSKKQESEKLNDQIAKANDEQGSHRKGFVWKDFSPDDRDFFTKSKESNKLNNQKIVETEEKIKSLRNSIDQTTENLAKYENRLQTLHNQIEISSRLVEQSKSQLRLIKYSDVANEQSEEIERRKSALEINMANIDKSYRELTKQLHLKQTEFAELSGKYNVQKEKFGTIRETLAQLRSELSQKLYEHRFSDINQVQQILDKNLAVSEIRNEIQQFHIQLQVLIRQVENLKTQTAKDEFSTALLNQTSQQYTERKNAFEAQLSKTGGLEKELAQLVVEYTKKERLMTEFEEVSRRATNLKTLENLFRGNGFVNYVSTIHMQRLCEIANQRFHRLTKNQLSLTINDSNEFEVIDYLNNGYKRSVKTLSGGQSFQASLCLAIALAENIQSLNKSEKNFFFIDEGFGTQDHDSINTVFDTLQYLHQENRVVGIISHVEELKERMPRSITVVKEDDTGSKLKPSYT